MLTGDGATGYGKAGFEMWGMGFARPSGTFIPFNLLGSSDRYADVSLSWDAGTLTIDLASTDSDFSSSWLPVVLSHQFIPGTNKYMVLSTMTDANTCEVEFITMAGAKETTADADMFGALLFWGEKVTKTFTDSSTTLAEANFNKLITADGTVGSSSAGFSCWGSRIQYTGAAWTPVTGYGSSEKYDDLVLTWVTNHIQIDIPADFNATWLPVPMAGQTAGMTSKYMALASQASATRTNVYFYDMDGTLVTTEDTSMDFNIIWWGEKAA